MSKRALPREMARQCLSVRVRLLNRTLTRIYDDALRPYRLTSSQLNILLAVAAFGPAEGRDIAAGLGMDKSTLSRNLTRLVERGLVKAEPSGRGTGRTLAATRRCFTLLQRVEPAWRDAQERARGLLGESDAEALAGVADRVWAAPIAHD